MKQVQLLICILFSSLCFAQFQIKGEFSALAKKDIQLIGFEGLENYIIAQTTTDEKGSFVFQVSEKEQGMGLLSAGDNQNLIIVLAKENIHIKGVDFASTQKIEYVKGNENILFSTYAQSYPLQKNALSAWEYLQQLYQNSPVFSAQKTTLKNIENEMLRIQLQDESFLNNLPEESYISWFIPVRKWVSEVNEIAQRSPQRIAPTIDFFRKLDYTDVRFYKSGLYRDAIEAHYWLIENAGQGLEEVISMMNTSTDILMENLKNDPDKLNEVTEFLFQYLENKSLYKSAEHLAQRLLNDEGCLLDEAVSSQLEVYRKMKIGNVAEEIVFSHKAMQSGKNISAAKLSDIESSYYVIAFGSSWCPACVKEIPKLVEHYQEWKAKGVEIVFISLDTDEKKYVNFTKDFPFISHCDFKKWKTKPAKDYYVNATPSLYLLDANKTILLKPKSIEQLKAWIDLKI